MNVLSNEDPEISMLNPDQLPLITQEFNHFFNHAKNPQLHRCLVDARIIKAVDFINEHYRESIHLTTVAQEVCLSKRSLRRLLKQFVGYNYIDFITRVRVGHAMHLLRTTTEPIASVMASCGFVDGCTFTRALRSRTGMTPIAFRKWFQNLTTYSFKEEDTNEKLLQVAEHGSTGNELSRYRLLASNPRVGEKSIEM